MQQRRSKGHRWQDELTRKLILDAAMQIILEEGSDRLVMEHLARRAGVAKGTLYLHFAGKDEVIQAAMDTLFAPLFAELDRLYAGQMDPLLKIERAFRAGLVFFEARLHLFRVLVQDRDAFYDDRVAENSPAWKYQERIREALEEAGDRLRPLNIPLLANMIMEAQSGQIFQRVYGRAKQSIDEQVRQFMDILNIGLAQPALKAPECNHP